MKQSRFPEGWNAERVRRVLEHYDSQSDEEAAAEDETHSPEVRRARGKSPLPEPQNLRSQPFDPEEAQ